MSLREQINQGQTIDLAEFKLNRPRATHPALFMLKSMVKASTKPNPGLKDNKIDATNRTS